ncbi:hypothetical protein L484_017109 [Morus notabilis]|uniref:Uncharacterized protein n=1 Tax=Morus notabilis TaxID=981085 RepID=W9S9P7_9ROSA|nr:hypothetical protein L484_017109 [Morus notabilis]
MEFGAASITITMHIAETSPYKIMELKWIKTTPKILTRYTKTLSLHHHHCLPHFPSSFLQNGPTSTPKTSTTAYSPRQALSSLGIFRRCTALDADNDGDTSGSSGGDEDGLRWPPWLV